MRTRIFGFIGLSFLSYALLSALPAHAQEWSLSLTPQFWAVSLDGSVTTRGNKTDVDASFSDIWDESDSLLAFNNEIEFHYDRFGFLVNPNYAKLGVDDVANGTILEGDLTMEMFFLDLFGMYRVADWDMESTTGGEDTHATFDLLAGVRYTELENELELDAGPEPDQKKDWWDPVVGASSVIDLTPRWFFAFRGDLGGFGAGSDFTANAMASIGYRFLIFNHPVSVRAGYQGFFQDYDEDSGADRYEWDMTIHGPKIGFTSYWGSRG